MTRQHIPRRRWVSRELYPARRVLIPGTRRPPVHRLSMRAAAARREFEARRAELAAQAESETPA